MSDSPIQVCVVGNELVAGVGDPRALGWVGRVASRSPAAVPPEIYSLAAPMETTAELAERWQDEVDRRFLPGFSHRLVVAPGTADLAGGISLARTRLNLAGLLDIALRRRIPTMVVGPPPGPEALNDQIQDLSTAYAQVTERRSLIYVDTFSPLVAHEQWLADLAAGDGHHPGQAGYGLIAWLVLHNGWHAFLGIDPPE